MTVPRSTAKIRERHERRLVETRYPEMNGDGIAEAWHSLQLHWLRSVPGYRAEVRARVAEAARQAERRARLVEGHQKRHDTNLLNREVEGCG